MRITQSILKEGRISTQHIQHGVEAHNIRWGLITQHQSPSKTGLHSYTGQEILIDTYCKKYLQELQGKLLAPGRWYSSCEDGSVVI